MQYYTERHRHTCGVDLHGRNLYLCVLDPDREIVLHRTGGLRRGKAASGAGAVPGRPGDRRRVHVQVVLARRYLR